MRTTILAATAAALVASALLAAPAVAGQDNDFFDDLKVIGLTTGGTKLVKFDSDNPRGAKSIATVSGLVGDVSLVGIDYRVQDGLLYGLGNAGGIYTLSTSNAQATKVGALTVALEGAAFGVDFNPAANALRVVSDAGQNLRHPFAGATAGMTQVDARLNVSPAAATGITAVAYTNNDLSLDTATTLFDIDTTLDQVVLQSPANSGILVPTGKLKVDAAPDAGFEIYSMIRNGRTVDVAGFATLTTAGSSDLYRIELLTGEATKIGTFKTPVTDLAIPLDQY